MFQEQKGLSKQGIDQNKGDFLSEIQEQENIQKAKNLADAGQQFLNQPLIPNTPLSSRIKYGLSNLLPKYLMQKVFLKMPLQGSIELSGWIFTLRVPQLNISNILNLFKVQPNIMSLISF